MKTANRVFRLLSGSAIWVGVASMPAFAAAPAKPPVAAVHPVVTDYFGTKVTDDYRWMEAPHNAALAAYMKGQAIYTNEMLARIPGRAKLAAAIGKVSNIDTSVYWVSVAGGKYFYMKIGPGQNVADLYVRDGLTGKETKLIDPMSFSKNGVPQALNFYQPSDDGKYVAYGVSGGGSENATLRVIDVATGKDMGVAISRVEGANGEFQPVYWAPDNHSFFYYRLQDLGPNADPSGYFLKSRAYLNVLGQDGSGDSDKPIFGFGVNGDVPVAPDQDSVVITVPGSPYAFGVLTQNESSNLINDIYAAKLSDIAAGHPVWTKIVGKKDDVTGFTAHGDMIDILTSQDAPRYKVVETSIATPDFAHAKIVVPQTDAVITSVSMAQDGLYAQTMLDGMGHIAFVPMAGGAPQDIPMPFTGSIGALASDPTAPGVLFHLSGWTKSPAIYQAIGGNVTNTNLEPASKADFSDVTSIETKAVSWDGTMVPLSIIMKKGEKLDGSHPTLLIGYGSYGITITPFFAPEYLPWINRGGIVAVAHVRGGGWYGDAWHKAGMKLTKMNTWQDFIACGQYLVDHGYTSPAHLAGEGGSAGGITISRAIETRPDLFAAGVDSHGETDTLRSEFTPNGPPNISEFGTVTNEPGFHGLYAMSGQVHLRRGVKYPAMFMETGANDPRVEPWEVAKFTAGLQADSISGKPILMRVSYQSGHGIGSTKAQEDSELADELSFLLWQTGQAGFQPQH